MKHIIYITIGTIAAAAVIAMIVTAAIWPVLNEVETGNTPEYPDIRPHYYSTEPARIYDEAVEVVRDLEQWKIVDEQIAAHRLDTERTTHLLGFVDDVTIRVEPVTDFVSRVHLHSRSRIGYADFGQNARNIREFLDELDERLGSVRFDPHHPGESEVTDEEQTRSEQRQPIPEHDYSARSTQTAKICHPGVVA